MGSRNRRRMQIKMVHEYMRRRRQWTIEVLPSMPPEQWKELEEWWAGFHFGGSTKGTARTAAITVTAPVTNGAKDNGRDRD